MRFIYLLFTVFCFVYDATFLVFHTQILSKCLCCSRWRRRRWSTLIPKPDHSWVLSCGPVSGLQTTLPQSSHHIILIPVRNGISTGILSRSYYCVVLSNVAFGAAEWLPYEEILSTLSNQSRQTHLTLENHKSHEVMSITFQLERKVHITTYLCKIYACERDVCM